MSAKWRRVKAWDAANLTGPMAPLRWVLTAFSSITLAVTLLITVALYGTLASVPIGLLALIPTKLFELVLFLMSVGIAGAAGFFLSRGVAQTGAMVRLGRELRFIITLALLVLGAAIGYLVWARFIAPVVAYQAPIESLGREAHGVRFFKDFVETHKSTLLRQLPSWEMTELEFYGWWPFKLVLIVFVINMMTATVRRIEFKFVNIGVLTVHTGIITIALGSIFYQRGKVEGDIRLVKGMPPKSVFYDAIIPAVYLWSDTDPGLFVHPLRGLSRYNDAPAGSRYAPDDAIHSHPRFNEMFPRSLEVNVVGVIPYGQTKATWVPGGTAFNPSINVGLHVTSDDRGEIDWSQRLIGGVPTDRALGAVHLPGLSIEHVVTPDPQRVKDLLTEFPTNGDHALIVRVPDAGFEQIFTVTRGQHVDLGDTGWSVDVKQFQSSDEGLALISKGYRGARSSRAQVEITAPDGTVTQRSVLHQYPELTQDFKPNPSGGMPQRTSPDPRIEIVYLDASQMSFWIVQDDPAVNKARVIERLPGGEVTGFAVSDGDSITGDLKTASMRFTFSDFWPRTMQRTDVVSVPRFDQDRNARGTYFYAFLDVELSVRTADGTVATQRRWLRFNQYLDQDYPFTRVERVTLPEVGTISLAFGRLQHMLPDLGLSLRNFEMIPYPGTTQPRDYVSTLDVYTMKPDAKAPEVATHITRLNRPYIFRRPARASLLGGIASWIAPDQYKFSQAGWDPDRQQYTVLGVGNNPGIYVIALGGILMGLGIPWAFYVKPAILRYKRRKIERALQQGTYDPPEAHAPIPVRSTVQTQRQPQQPSEVAS